MSKCLDKRCDPTSMCCIALRHNMARNSLHAQGRVDRSHGPLPLRRFLVLAVLVSGAVLLSAPVVVAAAKKGPKAFRCESEEDLDGSACRVDMLPDAALAEMIYERGFDAQGADRPQLLDAVMQLLDYEEATGEDLREMDYIPDDGSAAAAAEAAAAELEAAAAAAAAAAMAAETEAAAATGARGRERGGDTTSAEEFEEMEAVDGGSSASSRSKKKADKGRAASGEASEGWDQDSSAGSDLMDQSTVLGFAHNLGAEVLSTMKRDLNAVVGLLPAPVAKPIRDVAGVVGDITGRFAFPALKQAERYSRVLRKQAGRYTKVLRRHAGKAIGKAAVRVKEDYGPRMARGMGTLLSKGKRRLGEALGKAGKRDQRKKEGVEEGDEGEDEQ